MSGIYKEKVNIDEIKSLGKLNYNDIRVDNECEFQYPCNHNLYIKYKPLGKRSGLFINKLYKLNDLRVPDHFAEYDDNYFDRLLDPQPPTADIIYISSGGAPKVNYYEKYLKYKQKYLSLKKKQYYKK
jgi:hypothetical protein